MDKLVVDCSVVIKWFSAEPLSTEAHRILYRYQTEMLSLLAPDFLYAEVGNVIWIANRL